MPKHLVARIAHQRGVALDTRERLLDQLKQAPDRVVLTTCRRVEVYAAVDDVEPIPEMSRLEGLVAAAHLFSVASGLDSAIAGEERRPRYPPALFVAFLTRDFDPPRS